MIGFKVSSDTVLPIHRVSVMDENKEIGFYLLIPHSVNVYEVHTHFYPVAYGSAVEISKEFLKFVVDNNKEITTIITKIPVDNKLAKRLALKCGFVLYGELPSSFITKENEFISQEMYYISRGGILCL